MNGKDEITTIWLNDIIADLKDIWEKFFGIDSKEVKYKPLGDSIILPAFMFKYYNTKGWFDNLYKLIYSIAISPNLFLKKDKQLIKYFFWELA